MQPFVNDVDFQLFVGDVRDVLASMPDESVHCCVTSPPYWGLRDYGVDGQLGLEATPEEYVARMVAVFREVRRVLRSDGTCWLNLGDSYVSQGGPQVPQTKQHSGSGLHGANRSAGAGDAGKGAQGVEGVSAIAPRPLSESGRGSAGGNGSERIAGYYPTNPGPLKPKDLVGIPWRVAFALQADGWYLRSDIIWAKPNPMPESVTDRPTKSHEYVFLLTKSARYFYDADAIREPYHYDGRNILTREAGEGSHENHRTNGGKRNRWPGIGGASHEDRATLAAHGHDESEPMDIVHAGRNARSVWEIATQPYPEAHFATFPQELPRRCIVAGCPTGGTVLDPFMGSGTTALVARRLGRKSVGIELNPTYAEMCARRLGQQSLLSEGAA